MHQTLFVTPSFLFDGYLLAGWFVIALVLLGLTLAKGKGGRNEAIALLPFLIIVGLVIHFVLPSLQVTGFDAANPTGPEIPLGLAIQGYGFFLLTGIVFGVGLVMIRCRQVGLNTDRLLSLAFWMIVTGILGARIFYIVQKRDQFTFDSITQVLPQLFDMTNGGLVVYGSLIGGFLGAVVYLWRAGLPHARIADIIVPGMVLGLCIGRLGCLMNGCCYGGVCEQNLPAISFPPGSASYSEQLVDGDLLGIEAGSRLSGDAYPIVVKSVEPDSLAADAGIKTGDQVGIFPPPAKFLRAVKQDSLDLIADTYIETKGTPGGIQIPVGSLPDRSLGTHPTQVYSSINALFLCLVLWFYYPFRHADGEVFALMLILYPVARFLLEMIRIDEAGAFGTAFTISQLVSIGLFAIGVCWFARLRTSGKKIKE